MSEAVWPIYWLDETGSTNEDAKEIAAAGVFANQWIAARHQTAGRGRAGRKWSSATGNLYTTALFHWAGSVAEATRIPFAAALSVSDAIAELAPASTPKLKWPNDVRCAGRKISGILIETGENASGRWVAAGIGINVAYAPDGLDQETVSIADLRGDTLVDAQMALEALRAAFAVRLAEAIADFAATRASWLARADGLGEQISVRCDDMRVEGIFKDMDADGALLLELDNGDLRTIRTGDVHLIREVG